MPTAASDTFNSNKLIPYYHPEDALMVNFKFANSTTIAAGTVMGELSATAGNVKAYASGSSDGSEVPIGVSAYDVTVDASGNHTWGGSSFGETRPYAPLFISGYFRTTDLTGLDANAVGKLGRLVEGSVADGVVHIE